jgi:F-box domain
MDFSPETDDSNSAPIGIEILPLEIKSQIVLMLDVTSIINLRQVNREFRSLIKEDFLFWGRKSLNDGYISSDQFKNLVQDAERYDSEERNSFFWYRYLSDALEKGVFLKEQVNVIPINDLILKVVEIGDENTVNFLIDHGADPAEFFKYAVLIENYELADKIKKFRYGENFDNGDFTLDIIELKKFRAKATLKKVQELINIPINQRVNVNENGNVTSDFGDGVIRILRSLKSELILKILDPSVMITGNKDLDTRVETYIERRCNLPELTTWLFKLRDFRTFGAIFKIFHIHEMGLVGQLVNDDDFVFLKVFLETQSEDSFIIRHLSFIDYTTLGRSSYNTIKTIFDFLKDNRQRCFQGVIENLSEADGTDGDNLGGLYLLKGYTDLYAGITINQRTKSLEKYSDADLLAGFYADTSNFCKLAKILPSISEPAAISIYKFAISRGNRGVLSIYDKVRILILI